MKLVFKVTDDQETWVFEDIESALEHIRAGVEDGFVPPEDGTTFTLTVAHMTQAAYDSLPVH